MAETPARQAYLESLDCMVSAIAVATWDALEGCELVEQYIDPDENGTFQQRDWERFIKSIVDEDGIAALDEMVKDFDEIIAKTLAAEEANDDYASYVDGHYVASVGFDPIGSDDDGHVIYESEIDDSQANWFEALLDVDRNVVSYEQI